MEAWMIWIGAFVIIEGRALLDSKKGDTFSEAVWKWFNIEEKESNWTGKRMGLLAGFIWLVGHLVWRIW